MRAFIPFVKSSVAKANPTLRELKHTRNHPKSEGPLDNTTITKMERDTWIINLVWSREAIDEAAHEMTFWYMGQVGKKVYAKKEMPKEWEGMTHEEAGMNAIKMMLRLLDSEHEALATKFYNIYGFGYPLGMKYYEREQMIWSQKGKLEGLKTFERKKRKKRSCINSVTEILHPDTPS